jgi:hypothetical protein
MSISTTGGEGLNLAADFDTDCGMKVEVFIQKT